MHCPSDLLHVVMPSVNLAIVVIFAKWRKVANSAEWIITTPNPLTSNVLKHFGFDEAAEALRMNRMLTLQ